MTPATSPIGTSPSLPSSSAPSVRADVDYDVLIVGAGLSGVAAAHYLRENLASSFGYTNASWTLKAELIAQYVCRLVNHMKAHHYDVCVARLRDTEMSALPAVDLTSGYIQRASDILPRQGLHKPWKYHQNYLRDLASLRFGALNDGVMQFERRPTTTVRLNREAQEHA